MSKANAAVLSNLIHSGGANRIVDSEDIDELPEPNADFSGNQVGKKNYHQATTTSEKITPSNVAGEIDGSVFRKDSNDNANSSDLEQVEIDLVAAIEAIEKTAEQTTAISNGSFKSAMNDDADFPDDIDENVFLTLSQAVEDQIAIAKSELGKNSGLELESDTKMDAAQNDNKTNAKDEGKVHNGTSNFNPSPNTHGYSGPPGYPYPGYFPPGCPPPGYPPPGYVYPPGYQYFPPQSAAIPQSLDVLRSMVPMYNCQNVVINFANYNGNPPENHPHPFEAEKKKKF